MGLCIRWPAVNNSLGGASAPEEGKVQHLFRKTLLPRSTLGLKGRVPAENWGKPLMNWAHPSSCIVYRTGMRPSPEADVGIVALEGTQLGREIQYFSHLWPHNDSKTSKYLYHASQASRPAGWRQAPPQRLVRLKLPALCEDIRASRVSRPT